MRAIAFAAPLFLAACAYLLPASWRSFSVDPDEAAPAVTRALDAKQLVIAEWDETKHRVVTEWNMGGTATTRSRERYIVSWEHDKTEEALTIYVRHQAQDQDVDVADGRPKWSAVYHSSDRERDLLDAITRELSKG